MLLSTDFIFSAHPVMAVQFDGKGGWNKIDATSYQFSEFPVWIHLNYLQPQTQQWLQQQQDIPDSIREALLGESKRPRCSRVFDGFFITLRGVPNHPNDNNGIMNSLRIYLTDSFIITTNTGIAPFAKHYKDLLATQDIAKRAAEWLIDLVDAITDKLSDQLDEIYEKITNQENELLEKREIDRVELAQSRKQLILLRRYLLPQRDVIHKLAIEKVSWLQELERHQLQELSERIGRCVDDVDSAISRTVILAEETSALLAEEMNKRTYTMSILAAIFLPVSFLTGLFGVNLAGIPGGTFQHSFLVFCFVLVLIGLLFGWWLNRKELK